ncbi:excinuclease ABC subunit UvrC [Alicyclobacillaceae bacterium I2511]|nr:excinuclease ABC subunit UvrC [Alicyclobacillaceae bacterium I2511]
MNDLIRSKLGLLPTHPGVYLMKDSRGSVIYVGKAKTLRNRVRSYFTGSHDKKTQTLVSHIADFEYIVTDTVVEALLLECNLIKQYTPTYNIMLRDDKAYPYIKLTQEQHPRLEIVRKVHKDKAKYFGPYPNATAATDTKRLLERLYPLRKCRKLKKQACLYYHIGQCMAPCEFVVEPEKYEAIAKEITDFLNGGHKEIVLRLQQQMQDEAQQLNFERAKELRDLIRHIGQLMESQKVTNLDLVDRDVFGYQVDRGLLCVQVFYVRVGKVIERSVDIMQHFGDPAEDFISYVEQFYYGQGLVPKEVLLPQGVVSDALSQWLSAKCLHPQRGPKRQLVELATENARIALTERLLLMDQHMDRTLGAVLDLGEILGISAPHRIEMFDNSNIQGTDPVAALAVFVDGKPAKEQYRKYKIRTVQGANDYASMREVVRRRYARILREKGQLPDLIVIDGGRAHIAAVMDVLENELDLDMPICGLAKDIHHKTSHLFYRDEPEPVRIERHSPAFYLLERIQDEVHRFAITFHRQVRARNSLVSRLEEVPGIGPARRKRLLQHFGSLTAIQTASLEQFAKAGIGESLARAIVTHLQQK